MLKHLLTTVLASFSLLAFAAPPPITAMDSSVTAFVGVFANGPINAPTLVKSFSDYQSQFVQGTTLSESDTQLKLFFLNGGTEAVIVRVDPANVTASGFVGTAEAKTGLYAIESSTTHVSLITLPGATALSPADLRTVQQSAVAFAASHRAFAILDAPKEAQINTVLQWKLALQKNNSSDSYGALYFPALKIGSAQIDPSGAIAGIFAKTEHARHLWKSPAGTGLTILGIDGLSTQISQQDSQDIAHAGVNPIMKFPSTGIIPWGARTLQSSIDDFVYIGIRRLSNMINEAITGNMQWVLFEPNTPEVRAQVQTNVNDFMYPLFQKGAFPGSKPAQGYFVRCDQTNNTATDIQNGVLNLMIGFSGTRPSEFNIEEMNFSVTPAEN